MTDRQFCSASNACHFLAMTAILALASGCGDGGTADDKQAAKWVLERGGAVNVSDALSEIKAVDDLPTESFVLHKINFNRIERPITNKDLQKLPAAPQLEYLGLHSAAVNDKGIDAILKFQSLKELELSYTEVGDAALEQLAGLKELTKLFLYGTQISDEAVEAFEKKRPGCSVFRD